MKLKLKKKRENTTGEGVYIIYDEKNSTGKINGKKNL